MKTFEATFGKSLTVNTFSRNNTQIRCHIIGPHDITYSSLDDKKWKSTIEFLGDKDNSCSFKFINITNDSIGDWLLSSTCTYDYGSVSFHKDLIVTVYKSVNPNNLTAYYQDEFIFDING